MHGGSAHGNAFVLKLALLSDILVHISIKGKGGDWGDGFKSAYFQLVVCGL